MHCFFDLDGDDGPTRDLQGAEFASLIEVRRTALALLAEVSAHKGHDADQHWMTVQVRNGSGNAIYRARLTIEGTALLSC